jgi:putative oxidoreductase
MGRGTLTLRHQLACVRGAISHGHWALLPLRLLVGYGFAAHGYAKLARGPAAFAEILAAIGIPGALPTAWITSLLELVGGLAIIVGAAVFPLAVPFVIIMCTAMFGVHARYGFSSVRLKSLSAAGAVFGPVGYEVNLLYITALIALALGGSTPLSVDRWIEDRRRRGSAGAAQGTQIADG